MLRAFLGQPRAVWICMAFTCMGLLSFGLYLQHVVGLEPCPMCFVQRYAMVLITPVALLGRLLTGRLPTGPLLPLLG